MLGNDHISRQPTQNANGLNDARRAKLVAEAGAHGDLVASLGTPAAQHRCACLGLHPGKEPVGLRAVASVWLEGTLRHLIPLLLNFFAGCNSLSVYLKAPLIQRRHAKKTAYAR